MSASLPARPSLEWLRKRAKAILKQLRSTRPKAKLADAQLALARQDGFSSWRALIARLQAAAPLDEALVARFLERVGAGDVAAVRRLLGEHEDLVGAVGPHPFWGGRPQALHVAVETGRRPMVALLLQRGADVDGRNGEYDDWSPLLLAIDRKHVAIERMLRRRGARVGLVEALAGGDDRTALGLLARGRRALPSRAPNRGSLLMFARTPKAVDSLLELGVPADVRDRWGATPIEAFSRLGKAGAPLVRHLVSRGIVARPAEYARLGDRRTLARAIAADPGVIRDPAVLRAAVDFGHHALASWLLDRGADPNARVGGASDHTALHSAAWNGDPRMVKLLLARGADPTIKDRQYDGLPIDWASKAIEVEDNPRCRAVVAHLEKLDRASRPAADPKLRALTIQATALQLAAMQEPRFVPLLLPSAGPLDLFHAAVVLDEPRSRELLGSDPTLARATDVNGWTALHYCAASALFRTSPGALERQIRIARALLAAGADPSASYRYGGTWPISVLYHAAGQHDNTAMVELLLQAGADPADGEGIWHASDEGHAGALAVFERMVPADVLAAEASRCLVTQLRFGRVRGVPWLLAHGADPNRIEASTGDAALHAAARSGVAAPTVRLLVRHGADRELPNREGKTPAELGRARKAGP